MDLSHNALDVHQPFHRSYPIHDYAQAHHYHHHQRPLLNPSLASWTAATTSVQHQQRQQRQLPSSSPSTARPLTAHEEYMLAHLDRLNLFLTTAPSCWAASSTSASSEDSQDPSASPISHPALNRFLLLSGEYVSCILWNGCYYISGTDIVRTLVFRFDAFGRPVRNMKKFGEGVFSDLRNLKAGIYACIEEPKSPLLELLYKYQCTRTQAKQKVFHWFFVPHEKLFLDALERELKREKMGLDATTKIVGEPARSFTYDPERPLYEQFSKPPGAIEGEGERQRAVGEIGEVGSAVLPPGCVATSRL